jgi:hypothetical protein
MSNFTDLALFKSLSTDPIQCTYKIKVGWYNERGKKVISNESISNKKARTSIDFLHIRLG